MKRVIIVTECGRENIFYLDQDVKTVKIADETWVKETRKDDGRLLLEDKDVPLKAFLEKMLDVMKNTGCEYWEIHYKTTDEVLTIEWHGKSLPKGIFQL